MHAEEEAKACASRTNGLADHVGMALQLHLQAHVRLLVEH